MNPDFNQAIDELKTAAQGLQTGALSGVAHRDMREPALAKALIALAKNFGVNLQAPMYIDSNGEFSVIALNPEGPPLTQGCGKFGEPFAALLSLFRARTGIAPGHIGGFNGWCRLNHFMAEKLVLSYAAQLEASSCNGLVPAQTPAPT